jgi:hypothetical protein
MHWISGGGLADGNAHVDRDLGEPLAQPIREIIRHPLRRGRTFKLRISAENGEKKMAGAAGLEHVNQ